MSLIQNVDKKIRQINHARIDLFRKTALNLAKLLFDSKCNIDDSHRVTDSVLILRLDGKLGDSIVATAYFKNLKALDHQLKIIVVTNSLGAQIYQKIDCVDQTIIVDKTWISLFRAMKQLRSTHFKFIINTSYILTPRVVILMALLKSARKMTFGQNSFAKLFTDKVDIDFSKDHMTDVYHRAVIKIYPQCQSEAVKTYVVPVSESSKSKVENYLKINNSTCTIVLNSFAGGKLRNFSFETTLYIIQTVLQNPKCVVVSIANSGDHQILFEWQKKFHHERWIVIKELSSLEDNLALIQRADLVISPDTAIVHAACALNKRLLAIYRKDQNSDHNSVNWGPVGDKAEVLFSESLPDQEQNINDLDFKKLSEKIQKMIHQLTN